MTENERVAVTQADREAADDVYRGLYRQTGGGPRQEETPDNDDLVQAFARHRLASQPANGWREGAGKVALFDVPWCFEMDKMHGVNEVVFDGNFGNYFIRICEPVITSPTLVNGFPVPRDQWEYAYRYDEDRMEKARPIAWRPVPLPPHPFVGQPSNSDDAAKRELAHLSANARDFIARQIANPPTEPTQQDSAPVGSAISGGEVVTVAFVQEWMMSGDHEADQWHRDFAAAIDARTTPASPERGEEVDVSYEVLQGDDWCAASDSLAEATHYAAVYGQDGPTRIVKVTREPLVSAALTPVGEGK